jgi:hypothetical protein
LLHLIAHYGWHFVHIDESRAFLTAEYKGDRQAFTKFRGNDDQYFRIQGALYGLKTSPKDYHDKVAERFTTLGYRRLVMCSCIYILRQGSLFALVFAFVDDFIFTGNDRAFLESKIDEFRALANTTEPIWDPESILGMELSRDRASKTISCSMAAKIDELYLKHGVQRRKETRIPITPAAYIVRDEDFGTLPPEQSSFLEKAGITKYMCIVGCLIWISGYRHDIDIAVAYLTWNTKQPRQHHLNVALRVVSYLHETRHKPLVLGGSTKPRVIAESDASLGCGPRLRSVIAWLVKLSEESGAIVAKSKATLSVLLSSFDAKLDAAASAVKTIAWLCNILTELGQECDGVPLLRCDNEAMISFVEGRAVAKNARHIELRKWYLKEAFALNRVRCEHTPGTRLHCDQLTKAPSDYGRFVAFQQGVLGKVIEN